ncbi:hypothetical protein M3172_25290, partial [Mesobacillus subterraneus]|uniref:hypothetical protein n=1 Tax=Mesobacillus subterraneus TaxID=285983 RepID=UPI00203C0B1D
CNVTGTMVSFCGGMEKHLLQLDTFIVPEVPLILYALFEYGLTVVMYIFKQHYKNDREAYLPVILLFILEVPLSIFDKPFRIYADVLALL